MIGEFGTVVDSAGVRVEFTEGTTTQSGLGANAMGDPCEAVAWLTRSLAREGNALRAGDIVFTGGLTAPFDVMANRTYSLRSTALPDVELTARGAHGTSVGHDPTAVDVKGLAGDKRNV